MSDHQDDDLLDDAVEEESRGDGDEGDTGDLSPEEEGEEPVQLNLRLPPGMGPGHPEFLAYGALH